ncbi:MAG: hypothetical protein Q8M24_25215 [Pseudolabrys sp.]|nr:hypothetical protein [Pseudolabrys sp.]MDP2298752.1 hypothetical protein [Pseudolabrys sp.]
MPKNDTGATIFYPDTRFERLARRPGGVEREVALEKAQAAVDDIKPDFYVWINHEFDALNAALAEIERDPGDKRALERAFHSCAQLRDVSGTMGYELVTFIARTLCDILEAYIAGATYDKEVVDCHSNAFMFARMEQYRHLTPEQVPEMTQGLLRVVEIASIVPSKTGK